MLEIESYEESFDYDKHFKTDLDEFSEFQAIGPMDQSLYGWSSWSEGKAKHMIFMRYIKSN